MGATLQFAAIVGIELTLGHIKRGAVMRAFVFISANAVALHTDKAHEEIVALAVL